MEVIKIERLTDKQKQFANKYLVCWDIEEAMKFAGYSERNATIRGKKLLSKSIVKEYIVNQLSEQENSKIAKEKEILEYLSEILRGENILDDNKSKKSDEKDRMKAAELLGKRYGTFKESNSSALLPKVIISGEGDLLE